MALFRIVAPAGEPVTLVEAKAHLRIDHDADDGLVSGLIRAAREDVETRTGLALLAQEWRLTLDDWPGTGVMLLRRHPVVEIRAITVYGIDGEPVEIPPSSAVLDGRSRPARLWLERPGTLLRRLNGIEIDFAAGFGESGSEVPDSLRRAILMLVGHWYEFRAAFDAGDQPVSLPSGYGRLLTPWRSGRLL